MFLSVSVKDERLANWTTATSKMFSAPSLLSSTFPFVWGLEAMCPQVEVRGLLATRVMGNVKGGSMGIWGFVGVEGRASSKESCLVAGQGLHPRRPCSAASRPAPQATRELEAWGAGSRQLLVSEPESSV